jgi:nucleotide-binding universal stress UspA family protein
VAAAGGILVGYDGSHASERALGWAAREATARGLALIVCHAWAPACPQLTDDGVLALARRSGEQVIARGLRLAQDVMGPANAGPLLSDRPPAAILCERSSEAEMVVLGSHGLGGGVPGLLLGSVCSQVAMYAEGRVVVERGHWHPAARYLPGPVVVGVDGSAGSRAALGFGLEEAQLRAAPLLAVCALADAAGTLGDASQIQDDFEHLLGWAEKDHPEVTVLRRIADEGPIAALLTAARDAQMIVVGCRGRGAIRGMRLGSVGQGVLNHAPCPVGIAHQH